MYLVQENDRNTHKALFIIDKKMSIKGHDDYQFIQLWYMSYIFNHESDGYEFDIPTWGKAFELILEDKKSRMELLCTL